jgi:hypothetical protein
MSVASAKPSGGADVEPALASGRGRGRADEHADRHADGRADAEANGTVVDNAGAHVCGERTGQEQVQNKYVITDEVHKAAVAKHQHRQALRPCDELDLNCRLTENSVCCRKRCRSQLSAFWHCTEDVMQNIVRNRWGMEHIDMSARMPRLLQGYVICDACFADDDWDKATNGLIRLTFSGVRPASPAIARLNLQPGDIDQTKHVGEQLAAIMAERQPLQLVASQNNGAVNNNALLGSQGTLAIGIAAAVGSAFAALRVAREPRRDFDYEPRRPPPMTVPHLLRSLEQRPEPSLRAPHADRSPSPRSPAEQSDNVSPSVRSCSQAGGFDWGCDDNSAYDSSADDAEQDCACADDSDSSDGGLL